MGCTHSFTTWGGPPLLPGVAFGGWGCWCASLPLGPGAGGGPICARAGLGCALSACGGSWQSSRDASLWGGVSAISWPVRGGRGWACLACWCRPSPAPLPAVAPLRVGGGCGAVVSPVLPVVGCAALGSRGPFLSRPPASSHPLLPAAGGWWGPGCAGCRAAGLVDLVALFLGMWAWRA